MSKAVLSQSPVVDIGRSVRNTLICLGLDTAGREYTTFSRQMSALFACRLSLGFGSERFEVWEDSADAREKRRHPILRGCCCRWEECLGTASAGSGMRLTDDTDRLSSPDTMLPGAIPMAREDPFYKRKQNHKRT